MCFCCIFCKTFRQKFFGSVVYKKGELNCNFLSLEKSIKKRKKSHIEEARCYYKHEPFLKRCNTVLWYTFLWFSKKKIISTKKFHCFEKQHNFSEILPTRCHFTAIDLVNCLKYKKQKKSVLGHLRSVFLVVKHLELMLAIPFLDFIR